jgi:hypothetical protein
VQKERVYGVQSERGKYAGRKLNPHPEGTHIWDPTDYTAGMTLFKLPPQQYTFPVHTMRPVQRPLG